MEKRQMAGLEKADSGYEEGTQDSFAELKGMIQDLSNNVLSELSTINDKLDVLSGRVSRLEMQLCEADPKRMASEAGCQLPRHQGPESGVRLRAKPHLRRLKAVSRREEVDSSSSDGSFCIKLEDLDFDGVCCNIYKDVLIQEHEPIVNDVNLCNTEVLDRMLAEEAITSSDVEEIRLQGGRKEQTRSLLLMLEQRGHGPFVSFVNALEPEYNHLHSTLKRSLSIMCKEKQHGRLKCIVCKIIENVNPREVIDKYYSHRIVPSKVVRDIQHSGDPRKGWEQLRPHIKNEESIRVLAESLLPKFRSLREELDKFKEIKKFVCFCKRLSMKRKMEDFNKQEATPQSPVEHSESLSAPQAGLFLSDSSESPAATGVEVESKFNETGFREKFHRQAIRKKDTRGKSNEETGDEEFPP